MKMKAIILFSTSCSGEIASTTGYLIGAFIALIIIGYLLYALVKPEKF